jgi:hypothetical protein
MGQKRLSTSSAEGLRFTVGAAALLGMSGAKLVLAARHAGVRAAPSTASAGTASLLDESVSVGRRPGQSRVSASSRNASQQTQHYVSGWESMGTFSDRWTCPHCGRTFVVDPDDGSAKGHSSVAALQNEHAAMRAAGAGCSPQLLEDAPNSPVERRRHGARPNVPRSPGSDR